MKINIFPYTKAEKLVQENSKYRKNWISIRDIGFQNYYKNLDKYGENVLKLRFDDVTDFNIYHKLLHPFYEEQQKKRDLILFDENMARQIISFATNVYDKNETLNIHCWAGKSRSQAIGFCLNQYFNLFWENNEEDYIRNLQYSMPNFNGNFDVIKILTEELYQL